MVADPFKRRRHVGPDIVSAVFKVAGFIVLVGGGYAAYLADKHWSGFGTTNVAEGVAAIIAGTVFLAATLLFFAYVMDLLVDIDDDIRATGFHTSRAVASVSGQPQTWLPPAGPTA